MSEFHFLRPWFFIGFVPLLALLFTFNRRYLKGNMWQKVCAPHLLPALLKQVGQTSQNVFMGIFFFIGSLMLFALAGPTWQKLPMPSFAIKQPVVVVLDMSKLMNGKDIKPSRLSRAKIKIEELMRALPESQVGLVVFTQEGFIVSPLSKDKHTLKLHLNELQTNIMPVDGHNMGHAIQLSDQLLKQAGFNEGNIVIFTASLASHSDIKAAGNAYKDNFHVSVVGMGTKLGAPVFDGYGRTSGISRVSEENLRKVSDAGHGKFFAFDASDGDVKSLAAFINKTDQDYLKNQEEIVAWRDEGRYFIFLILPFVLLAFRKGLIEGMDK